MFIKCGQIAGSSGFGHTKEIVNGKHFLCLVFDHFVGLAVKGLGKIILLHILHYVMLPWNAVNAKNSCGDSMEGAV